MEQEKIIPAAEMQEAERMMSPEMIKMSEAREKIMDSKEALLSAGVSEELIKEAARKAEDLAKNKYEQLEKENPLANIEAALASAAQTEEEKTLVGLCIAEMETKRLEFINAVNRAKIYFKEIDPSFSTNMHRIITFLVNSSDKIKLQRPEMVGGFQRGLHFEVCGEKLAPVAEEKERNFFLFFRDKRKPEERTEKVIVPSIDFLERILKNMGALDSSKSAEDLKAFPKRDFSNPDAAFKNPYYSEEYNSSVAGQLATNIPGVEAYLDFKNNSLSVAITNMKSIENMIEA